MYIKVSSRSGMESLDIGNIISKNFAVQGAQLYRCGILCNMTDEWSCDRIGNNVDTYQSLLKKHYKHAGRHWELNGNMLGTFWDQYKNTWDSWESKFPKMQDLTQKNYSSSFMVEFSIKSSNYLTWNFNLLTMNSILKLWFEVVDTIFQQ